MNDQTPLPRPVAARAVIRCMANTVDLLRRGRMRLPREHVGMWLRFADGTSARVYRETVLERGPTADPCVLVVWRIAPQLARGPQINSLHFDGRNFAAVLQFDDPIESLVATYRSVGVHRLRNFQLWCFAPFD